MATIETRLHGWTLVAHELGGALAPVRSAVDLLWRGDAGLAGPETERLLGVAIRGLERADRVLQNLAAIAAPELHRTQLVRTDIEQLLARLALEFRLEAEARGLTLDVEASGGLVLPVDVRSLEQVLVNVVSNALKFTPSGGRVVLRAHRPRAAVLPGRLALLGGDFGVRARFVCLEVCDTGMGLSDEARRRLFEPFYRAPEAARVPGSGLGLAVAHRLVGHLHGELRPQPAPSGGTRFVLTLPGDEPTWNLVCALDGALAELDPWFTAGGCTLAVLRRAGGLDPQAVAGAAAALRAALGDPRALCLPLGTTTWVVATGAAVRALLAALPGSLGPAADASVRVHLQRVRRGRAADRVLLQSLVRCRHPLIVRHAKRKEVTDASGPARG